MSTADTLPETVSPGIDQGAAGGPAARRSSFRGALPAPRQLGLAAKIALWTIALGALVAATNSVFQYRSSANILIEREQHSLEASVDVAAARLLARMDIARRDVVFLSKTPPLTGLIHASLSGGADPFDGSTQLGLLDRLAEIFVALLEARPEYSQIRYIGLADAGREIVRVDRTADGAVLRTAEDQLQPTGDQPYIAGTIGLPAGAVYVSDVDLNREFGKIEVPHRPVIRVATPVYGPDRIAHGIVVVNIEARYLFDLISQSLGASREYFVTNDAGDYLVHPDDTKAFGFDRGQRHRLQEDIPAFAPLFDKTPAYAGFVTQPAGEYLAFGERLQFDPRLPQRYLTLVGLVPDSELLDRLHAERDKAVLLALAAIFAAVVVTVLLARAMVRPLREMAAAAGRMARGRRDIDLSDMARRGDETGELARAFATMAKEVTEREDRMAVQASELTRSNAELAQFAYVASHDLQEPLRMVASYLELLDRRYRDRLDDDAREFIGFAVDGATRMKQLINDLLGYSRAGNAPLKLETVDTEALVASVVETLSLQIEETHGQVAVGPLPTVKADPIQLARVFQNLVENALKYRSRAAPRVRISAETTPDGYWKFSVRDNGIGIDPRFSEKIFEIFKRLHGREKYAGTGIGLAVCKLVVERHGGRIWVEPHPQGGSVFHFTIPE